MDHGQGRLRSPRQNRNKRLWMMPGLQLAPPAPWQSLVLPTSEPEARESMEPLAHSSGSAAGCSPLVLALHSLLPLPARLVCSPVSQLESVALAELLAV